MKKAVVTLFVAAVFAAAATVVLHAAKAERTYTLGVFTASEGAGMESQYKTMFDDLAAILTKEKLIRAKIVTYDDLGKFLKAAEKGELDFTSCFGTDNNYKLASDYGYRPVVAMSIFNRKKVQYCIYTKTGGPVQKLEDLKGAKTAISRESSMGAYFIARKIIGAPPEKHMKLVLSPNSHASITALSLDSVDALITYQWYIDFFKMSNPTMVKGFRELACGEKLVFPPVMRSPKVPEDVVAVVRDMMVNIDRNEAFKKYRPLLRTSKISFFKASEEEYAPAVKLFEDAYRMGWNKDYAAWIAGAKQ